MGNDVHRHTGSTANQNKMYSSSTGERKVGPLYGIVVFRCFLLICVVLCCVVLYKQYMFGDLRLCVSGDGRRGLQFRSEMRTLNQYEQMW
mmetsp:Transcript_9094/g.22111  ORF Transcript_9094/g.22111 Transcript_9094/m.22111 type:complete len:90 (-) Transcript_9094:34-303(-)